MLLFSIELVTVFDDMASIVVMESPICKGLTS